MRLGQPPFKHGGEGLTGLHPWEAMSRGWLLGVGQSVLSKVVFPRELRKGECTISVMVCELWMSMELKGRYRSKDPEGSGGIVTGRVWSERNEYTYESL